MSTPPFGPEWQENLERSMRALGKGLDIMGRVLSAQGAMGWAYRGDLAQTRAVLAGMSVEQLQELSAAATMLAGLCDEEMGSR